MINIFLNGDKLRSTFTLVIGACLKFRNNIAIQNKTF
jgi:hypothetical protein